MTPDFTSIEYLRNGNLRQQEVHSLLVRHNIMHLLSRYQPLLTGTIPLEIDIETSDIDIVCYCPDPHTFVLDLDAAFSDYEQFRISDKTINRRPTTICTFQINGFLIEIFGQNRPSQEQDAFLHMVNEHRILSSRGEGFRQEIIRLKRSGLKTEPAFARALDLHGDPYEAMLRFVE